MSTAKAGQGRVHSTLRSSALKARKIIPAISDRVVTNASRALHENVLHLRTAARAVPRRCRRGCRPACIWATACGSLLAARIFDGGSFAAISVHLSPLDAYRCAPASAALCSCALFLFIRTVWRDWWLQN